MENNFEFRIWDKHLKMWLSFEDVYINPHGEICKYALYDVLPGDTRVPCVNPLIEDRFELSQSIGRKDSKGVKAFTGDILESSVYDRDHCEIVFRDGGYQVSVNNEEWHPIHDHFTVIGNKWEGIFPVKEKMVVVGEGTIIGGPDFFEMMKDKAKPIPGSLEDMQRVIDESEKQTVRMSKGLPSTPYLDALRAKWEENVGPEARAQSRSCGDSTVRQEGNDTGSYEEIPPMPNSNLSFQYDKEGTLITEEYLQILAERRFPDAGGHSISRP